MAAFRWLAEEVVHRGHVITLSRVTVEAPDGRVLEREVVHHPGAVAVVPLHGDGTVSLVRQYRAPLQQDLLEIPAGKRDKHGEPPEVTAVRELAEEVGLAAGSLVKLAEFFNSAGFCDELSHVYLALDLAEVAPEAQGIEEEHMTVERIPLMQAPALVADGTLRDAKTIIGLLGAIHWLAGSGATSAAAGAGGGQGTGEGRSRADTGPPPR